MKHISILIIGELDWRFVACTLQGNYQSQHCFFFWKLYRFHIRHCTTLYKIIVKDSIIITTWHFLKTLYLSHTKQNQWCSLPITLKLMRSFTFHSPRLQKMCINVRSVFSLLCFFCHCFYFPKYLVQWTFPICKTRATTNSITSRTKISRNPCDTSIWDSPACLVLRRSWKLSALVLRFVSEVRHFGEVSDPQKQMGERSQCDVFWFGYFDFRWEVGIWNPSSSFPKIHAIYSLSPHVLSGRGHRLHVFIFGGSARSSSARTLLEWKITFEVHNYCLGFLRHQPNRLPTYEINTNKHYTKTQITHNNEKTTPQSHRHRRISPNTLTTMQIFPLEYVMCCTLPVPRGPDCPPRHVEYDEPVFHIVLFGGNHYEAHCLRIQGL